MSSTGRKKGLYRPENYTYIGNIAIDLAGFYSRMTTDENGCRVWTAGKHRQGYGMVSVYNTKIEKRQMNVAHRVAMIVELGRELTRDEFIVHEKCDNPLCCNVDHLALGDAVERNRIQYARGRKPKPNPNTGMKKQNRQYKYSDDDMRLMRDGSIEEIVEKLKVTRVAASHLRHRMKKGYKWL
jgi:hypothetical protein